MPIASILLVDDAAETRSLIEKCFDWADGPTVTSTASVKEGIARANELAPDVVLANPRMPDMDLADFLSQLNRQQLRSPPIVILLTAKQPFGDRYKALGVAGTIAKPLVPDRFACQLREIVSEARLTLQLGNLHRLGGHEFVVEMIDLFLDLAPKKIADAAAALASGNVDAIRQAAHSLKSASANLGADALFAAAARAERAAAQEQVDILPALVSGMEQTFARVKTSLEQRKRAG
jgi:CheY-like chemotaxis protein